MRSIVVLLCVVAAACALDVIGEEWTAFKLEHNKEYESEVEEHHRRKIYEANRLFIAKHNQRYVKGLEQYELDVNEYSDMLHSEFTETMNGVNVTITDDMIASEDDNSGITFIPPANVDIPNQVDWRNKGAVTPVKNQRRCGSCWAFSSTGALEAQHFRKTGNLVPLSEQNLVDCSRRYGNNGCKGGLMDRAFLYIKNNNGIDTEQSYPYEAVDNRCRYNPQNRGATDRGSVRLPHANEARLMKAVATVGPISVAIDATRRSFQFYRGGVYFDRACSARRLTHAVLVVGYGNDPAGGPYWLVKNSWGTSWGQGGYVKMARNKRNHCGIASSSFYPLV